MTSRQVIRCFLECSKYLRGHWAKMALLFIAVNSYTVIALAVPLINKKIFDEVIPAKNIHLLYTLCIILVLVAMVSTGLTVLRGFLGAKLSQQLTYEIRLSLFDHLLRIPISEYANKRVGDLMSRVNGDASRMAGFLLDTLTSIFANVFTLCLAVALVFRTDWRLGLMMLVFIPTFGYTFFMYKKRRYELVKSISRKEGSYSSTIQEDLSAIYTVKALRGEQKEVCRLQTTGDELISASMQLFWLQNTAVIVSSLLSSLSVAAVILYGAYQVIEGGMTIGQTVAVNTWLLMSMSPVNVLANQFMFMHQVMGSVQRVLDILRIPLESDDPERTEYLMNMQPTIEFIDVAFRYGDTLTQVLHGVNLEIHSGERIALVGCSGAGKSTIVSLLLGMHKPTLGEIRVCGIDISRVRLDSLRDYIAVVSQDVLLMNNTVFENIRYGNPDAAEDAVTAAAQAAGADGFIEALPQGYQTVIGERGATLSGGQRQRIAIAQAFLRDAPILILDEATSAVDLETESIIHESLNRLMAGKTVILISHRESVLQSVDRIAVLEFGRIVRICTPSEFMRDELTHPLLSEARNI